MYESFFGFVKRPFLAVSTLDRYFPASSIEQTFQTAARAIQRGEGPVAIFGGTGLGKTMCCLRIAENFRRNFEVVMLASSQLITRRALLQSLLFELRMPYRDMSEGELRLTLMNRLQPSTENPTDGLVLIVDEAQTLSMKLLEEIRLLTNVVRNGVPRVRLVLCGSMRLDECLANPFMDSLNQRLAARCYLTPLSIQETSQYVVHKIELSGVDSERVVTRDALDAIYRGSDGIPRLIDQLADQALLLACNEREKPVSAAMVGRAWCMLQQLPNPWSEPESIAKSSSGSIALTSNSDDSAMPTRSMASNTQSTFFGNSESKPRSFDAIPTPNISENSVVPPSIEFGQLADDDVSVELAASTLNQLTSQSPKDDELILASKSTLSERDIPIASPPKNRLDVFSGDFDEEFSIPVQSSGSYQAYSGTAYGNLNYDLSTFGTKPEESISENRYQIEEANDFLINPFSLRNSQESKSFDSPIENEIEAYPLDQPVSNISPEQAANLERQIEEEMRDLVSGLNMSAMSFDPTSSIDTLSNSPSFTYDSVSMGAPQRDDQRLAYHAQSDVISFSGLHSQSNRDDKHTTNSSRYSERAAMSDDRDLLVIEDELENVRSGTNQATIPTSRALLHPYAKLFTKLRNS